MSIKNTVVQNVRDLRKQRGLSQAEFAELIDASHSHVRQVESGQSGYSLDMLEKMAEHFDVDVAVFFKSQETLRKERKIAPDVALKVIAESLGMEIEIKSSRPALIDSELASKIASLGEREMELLKLTVDKMVSSSIKKKKVI